MPDYRRHYQPCVSISHSANGSGNPSLTDSNGTDKQAVHSRLFQYLGFLSVVSRCDSVILTKLSLLVLVVVSWTCGPNILSLLSRPSLGRT